MAYGRAHYPDGEFHSGLITKMLKSAYTDRAGLGQKVFNTRRSFKKKAEKGLLAEVFSWHPWNGQDRLQIGSALLLAGQNRAMYLSSQRY